MSVLLTISVIASIIAMLTAFAVVIKKHHTLSNSAFSIVLYQCKTIMEAHAGVFKVDSKEGRGTDFTFYLPLLSD